MPLLFFFLADRSSDFRLSLTFVNGTCLLNDKWGRNWGIRLKGEEGGSVMGHNGPCALQH